MKIELTQIIYFIHSGEYYMQLFLNGSMCKFKISYDTFLDIQTNTPEDKKEVIQSKDKDNKVIYYTYRN